MSESALGLPPHLEVLSTLPTQQPQGAACVATIGQVMQPLSDLQEAAAPSLLGQPQQVTVQTLLGGF